MRIAVCALVLFLASGALFAESKNATKNVAILLYDGVEVLDFAGPAEVFAAAAGFGASDSLPAFNVYTVSRTKAPIVSQGFLDIVPDYSIADSPQPDILVLPGGNDRPVTTDEAWMAWIRTAGHGAEQVLTICTGAFLAGRVGLLDSVDATTFYRAVPGLAEEFPKARVQPGRRFVDSGKVITTAGVSAGIDGSLHLVARLLGRQVADRTAEYMEYKWAPESYLSSQYTLLDPRLDERGRTLQLAAIAVREGQPEAAQASYRALIEKDRSDAEAWLQLGLMLHSQEHYGEAIAAYQEAAKGSAQRGRALFNLSCGYALTGEPQKALDAAEQAFGAGFRLKWAYREDADLASIRAHPRFQALLAKL